MADILPVRTRIIWTALLLVAAILFPAVLALELSPSLSAHVTTELDRILEAARIELPSRWEDGDIQAWARDLMFAAQRARVAIASHVISSPFSYLFSPESVEHAAELNKELSERISLSFIQHLDQANKLDSGAEWAIHRGLFAGVLESKQRNFIEQILRPSPTATSGATIAARLKHLLKQVDPLASIRRWRIRRLLDKLSTPTSSNLDALRARLSATTAQKSVVAQTAAAVAKDAQAARRIEFAPAIRSEIVLDEADTRSLEQAQRKLAKKRPGPALDGQLGKFEPQWIKTLNRGPAVDWTNIPIPGMAR